MHHIPQGVLRTLWEAKNWPVGQVVKTAASHAANRSSTLLRVTIFLLTNVRQFNTISKLISGITVNIVGVDYGEGPPVPIPNTEVKLTCAHDTWLATARENR